MLKTRLISAIILIPIFVLLTLKLPTPYFGGLTAIITLLAAWEWSGLMGLKKFLIRFCYPVIIVEVLFLALFIPIEILLAVTFIWWLLMLILVLMYPNGSKWWSNSIIVRGLMGFMTLMPTWVALNYLHSGYLFGGGLGAPIVLFLFVLIWGADSGAYFAGRLCGKHKLAPSVSPGKTWEGFIGAMIVAILLAPILAWLWPVMRPHWIFLILLSLITVKFSILGDLFESMLKRNVGLKDSGRMIPGHGGLLDRIDSLTAAAPIFAFGCYLITKLFH
jgi:phosphatidate cytidylyltransferase